MAGSFFHSITCPSWNEIHHLVFLMNRLKFDKGTAIWDHVSGDRWGANLVVSNPVGCEPNVQRLRSLVKILNL